MTRENGSSSRPRLLDLFCGAGGAAMGYYRAGFDVVGVDIKPQPHYPFEFQRADALETLALNGGWSFDVIHASPPCQAFTAASELRKAQHGTATSGDLLTPTLERLRDIGLPWVVENVPRAPIDGITLCGSMWPELRCARGPLRRHRIFASNIPIGPPRDCFHDERPVGVYHVMGDSIPHGGRTADSMEEANALMGIDWMTWDEIKEAIPPAYTEWIGVQLLLHLGAVHA